MASLLQGDDSLSVADRYILRQALVAFAIVLGVLTLVVWMTTALRQLELVTAQQQTFSIFLILTSLSLPMLMVHIAPFALFIGTVFVLAKLSGDSELIVLSATGLSEKQVLKPFLLLAFVVTLLGWLFTLWLVPASLRELRLYINSVRADLIGTIVQPGKFTSVAQGVTFHVRDRASNGALLGVFVNDRRDEEMEMTYLSGKGLIIRTLEGTFLILENGQIIRRPKGKEFGSIIAFDRYAFNMSVFMNGGEERDLSPSGYSTPALLQRNKIADAPEKFLAQARSELHNRFALPLYNIAFALIAFAALGKARTTRHKRSRTIFITIFAAVLLRITGFGVSALAQRSEWAVLLIYLVPVFGIAAALVSGPFRQYLQFHLRAPLQRIYPVARA